MFRLDLLKNKGIKGTVLFVDKFIACGLHTHFADIVRNIFAAVLFEWSGLLLYLQFSRATARRLQTPPSMDPTWKIECFRDDHAVTIYFSFYLLVFFLVFF